MGQSLQFSTFLIEPVNDWLAQSLGKISLNGKTSRDGQERGLLGCALMERGRADLIELGTHVMARRGAAEVWRWTGQLHD